jgi:alpha-beta hydrolase superfamily lysophospholipase
MYVDPTKHGIYPRNIWFAAEDGTRLHGWLFSPEKPKARIAFFHGNAENLTSHWTTLIWILDQGFEFLIFDYRGYGLSDGKPSRLGTLMDGKAALKWLATEDPPLPLFVLGQSLGGAIALKTVAEWGQAYSIKGLVVDSTFASYQRVARRLIGQVSFLWPFQWLAHLLVSDEGAPEEILSRISPIPLLVFHGDLDRVVTYENGLEVFQGSKEPKTFVPVSGGKHIDALWRKDEPYRDLLVQWLNRRLEHRPERTLDLEWGKQDSSETPKSGG